MADAQRRYPFAGGRHTVEEVCDMLNLYSIDEIQVQMQQHAFGKELRDAMREYLKGRITSGTLSPHADTTEDPT